LNAKFRKEAGGGSGVSIRGPLREDAPPFTTKGITKKQAPQRGIKGVWGVEKNPAKRVGNLKLCGYNTRKGETKLHSASKTASEAGGKKNRH